MEEYQYDAERTDIAHGKEVEPIEPYVAASFIGEFVEDNLLGNIPAYKQTGQHAA